MKIKKMLLSTMILSLVSMPAQAIGDKDAEKTAALYVPAEAVLEKVEWDDGLYEVQFFVKETQERYEVRVHPESGEAVSLESEKRMTVQDKSQKMDETAAQEIVLAAYPGAKVLRVDEHRDDGRAQVAVFFVAEGCYGTLEIDAYSGEIAQREIYFSQATQDGLISQEQAQEIVMAAYPEAQISKIRLDEDDGLYCWEGDARVDGQQYEFVVNALTGKIIEWERD